MNNNNTKIIKVSGKKLDIFFQNLITNDINLLEKEESIYTCILSPQGKFLNDFFIVKRKDSYLIEINIEETNNLIDLLKKFDLRKSLNIKVEDNLKTFCYLKKDFISFKEKLLNIKNKNLDFFQSFTDPRHKSFLTRVWVDKNITPKINGFSNINYYSKIELERIKKLIPNSKLDLEKNKSFILNFGLDEINCISFSKGCYIGQENTARQKYRGKLKYKIKLLKIFEGVFPPANSELFYLNEKIGTMKSSEKEFGLALLRTDFINKDNHVYDIFPGSKVVIY